MSYRSNCQLCGESYDDENLLSCSRCGRDFCYRCGDWGKALCTACQEAVPAVAEPSRDPPQAPR